MLFFALGYIAGTCLTVGLLFAGFCLGLDEEENNDVGTL